MIRKAIVPAAGFGTRLRPLTNITPKELLPLGRKPVLSYVMEELQQSGIQEVLFIVSERKPEIRAFFGETYTGENPDLAPIRCEYTFQHQQRGSGDAVLCAADWSEDDACVVAFGDCIIDAPQSGSAPLKRMIETFSQQSAGGVILVESVPREKVFRYGVVSPATPLPEVPTESFLLQGVVEKPSVEEAPSNLVIAARFVLHPTIFTALRHTLPDKRGEFNLPDAMCLLPAQGLPLFATPLHSGEARLDIGNFETYFANFLRFALRDAEYGESLHALLKQEIGRNTS
jgi:UTP--glucose-1-phosphate uridylyltransferase